MMKTNSSNQPNETQSVASNSSGLGRPFESARINLLGEPVLPSLQEWRDAHKAAEQGNQHPLRNLMKEIPTTETK
jgi:hypothetical protein